LCLLTPLARPHGLSVGSLTSQIWANPYLSPIDHLLASELGIGSFVRYCDHWLIWDDDRGRLREALSRMHEHATPLRLRLHPRKPRLHRTTDSIHFSGPGATEAEVVGAAVRRGAEAGGAAQGRRVSVVPL
jgi:hypothetical protein